MANTLIGTNTSEYGRIIATLKSVATKLQSVVDNYNTLGLPALVSAELQPLFLSPVDLIFDKMTNGEALTLAGVEVVKSKAIEIMQKPVGYDDLLVMVDSVRKDIQLHESFHAGSIQATFIIDGSGQVQTKASRIVEIQEGCNLYARTDRANKMLQLANFVIAKAGELGVANLFIHNPNGPENTFKGIIKLNPDKTLGLNVEGILRFNSDTYNGQW